jgi:hypothetical protein
MVDRVRGLGWRHAMDLGSGRPNDQADGVPDRTPQEADREVDWLHDVEEETEDVRCRKAGNPADQGELPGLALDP